MSAPAVLPDLAEAIVTAGLIGATLLPFARFLVRRNTHWSARARHRLLGLAFFVPAISAGLVATFHLASPVSRPAATTVSTALLEATFATAGKFPSMQVDGPVHNAIRGESSERLPTLLIGLWLIGFLASLTRLTCARWAATKLFREATPALDSRTLARTAELCNQLGIRNAPTVLVHPDLAVPVVAGALRPALLLPRRLADRSELDMALAHELGHVVRRDPMTTLLFDLVAGCLWFLPTAHRVVRDLRLLQELAADRVVIDTGFMPSRYASFLLRTFRQLRRADAVPQMAAHSIVSRRSNMDIRLRTILTPSEPSRALSMPLIWVGAVALSLVLALSALGISNQLEAQRRPPTDLDLESIDTDSLDQLLRPVFVNTMADRYIAGSAIAVVHRGRLIYAEGFGHARKYDQIPVRADHTIWRIGSITKVLTGVAIMQLVERGLIDLDVDVNDYLTRAEVPPTYAEPVTVRHLLTHTAGFDQIGLGRHAATPEDVEDLATFLDGNLIRIRPPGQFATYDTYGITLAGLVIEEVSGSRYRDYLRDNIFEPLGMKRSGISVPTHLADDTAIGHGFAGEWEEMPWEYMNTDPASTVNSTVTDMANFAVMLLNEGRFGDRRVLREESVDAMLRRQFTNHPDQPGYGFTFWEDRNFGVNAFSHAGSMSGFGAMLYLLPDHDLGIFMAFNQESGTLVDAALSTLIGTLFPDRPADLPQRPRFGGDLDLSRFTGTWANSMHHHTDPATGWKRRPFELERTAAGDLLFRNQPARPVGPLTFQREDGLLLSFSENEDGHIERLFVQQTMYERVN